MSEIVVSLPSLLSQAAGGSRHVRASGTTVADVLDDLTSRHPKLKTHLFDEKGHFREHVLCFLNETNTRWLEGLDHPVTDGDSLTILQAVSGG